MLGFYAHCLTACSRQFGVMNIVNWHVLQSNQINIYIFDFVKYLIILLSVVALSCKKENKCHSGCYIVVHGCLNDTINFRDSAGMSVCKYYDILMSNSQTDPCGNPISKSQIQLVCP
jgi:hypothetical protein